MEEIFSRLRAAGLKLKLEKMQFLQKAHTVLRTSNISRWNTATTREARKHSKNACTQKPKRSKTISWTSRLLQKVRPQIHGYLKSFNTSNKEGCRIQIDPRM